MKEKDAEAFAQAVTECYASERGCNRMPVRVLVEIPVDKLDSTDAEFVLLCADHASTYIPHGKVIQDQILVSDEHLAFFQKNGI